MIKIMYLSLSYTILQRCGCFAGIRFLYLVVAIPWIDQMTGKAWKVRTANLPTSMKGKSWSSTLR